MLPLLSLSGVLSGQGFFKEEWKLASISCLVFPKPDNGSRPLMSTNRQTGIAGEVLHGDSVAQFLDIKFL